MPEKQKLLAFLVLVIATIVANNSYNSHAQGNLMYNCFLAMFASLAIIVTLAVTKLEPDAQHKQDAPKKELTKIRKTFITVFGMIWAFILWVFVYVF